MAWNQFDSDYQSFQNVSAAARVRGVPELIGATIAVPIADFGAGETATLVYQCEEVEADKLAATGAVAVGAIVRMNTAAATLGHVNTAVAAAANIACGFCAKAAEAAANKIVIRFDGTPRGA